MITNSGWEYTDAMMSFAYDSFLPAGHRWTQLFDLVRDSPFKCCLGLVCDNSRVSVMGTVG